MTIYDRDSARSALMDLHAWAAEWAEKAEDTSEADRARVCASALAVAVQNGPLERNDPPGGPSFYGPWSP